MNRNITQALNRRVYILISIVFIVISFLRYETVEMSGTSTSEISIGTIYLLIIYILSGYAWIRLTRRYYSPYFFYLVACFLFNAGQLFLNIFDFSNNGFFNIFRYYNDNTILQMIHFQTMCIGMLNIGALLAINERTKDVFKKGFIETPDENNMHLDSNEIIFTIVSIVLVAFYVSRVSLRLGTSYGDVYEEFSAEGGSYLIATITYLFYIFYFRGLYKNYHNKPIRRYYYFFAIIWLIMLLLIGGRFKLVPVIAGTFFIAVMKNEAKNKYMKARTIIIMLVLGIVILSFMEGLAQLRRYSFSSINFSLIKDIYSEGIIENLFTTISEAGASARCILSTMVYINNGTANNEPSFLYAFANGILPGSILKQLGFSMTNLSLSSWITALSGKSNGWGYSVIAECYYNLSEYGFIFMALFGFLLVKMEALAIKLFRTGLVFEQLLGAGVLFILVDSIFLARANMLLISPDIRRTIYVLIIGCLIQRKIKLRIPEPIEVQQEQ